MSRREKNMGICMDNLCTAECKKNYLKKQKNVPSVQLDLKLLHLVK